LLTVLLAGLATGGCAVAEGFGAVEVASIPVIHRTFTDAIYSAVTGKDCSIVRLDENKTYCRPVEPPPALPPYCTKSLGTVDCWQDPQHLFPKPPQVADGPMTLTPEQEANRTRRWPPL
jgi:hypothetical protein